MKKFQAKKEDFICEKCGFFVKGNGYTNHCPNCLWSKHVDINPGDRLETCQGMMEPIDLEIRNGEKTIIFRCQKCGKIGRNKISDKDSEESLILVIKERDYGPR